ncbi:DUF2768 domain-containing protein [Ectobacillus polymachus]|uniref:DUF2768 domain-containing protein n=1 Tax=Ectobacillus polymachus TaxID=1508806 RepID=UPI003A837FCF
MSVSLLKMWFSLSSIAGMSIAAFLILFSRYRLENKWWKGITVFFAYSILIVAGLLMVVVLLSGPS